MRTLMLFIFFVSVGTVDEISPKKDVDLSIRFQKDGETVGFLQFKDSTWVVTWSGGTRHIRKPYGIEWDKVEPNLATNKDGYPIFNGDITLEDHVGWFATGWHYGKGQIGYRFTPKGLLPYEYQFHYNDEE